MEWRSDEIKALRRALGLFRREFAKKLRTSRVLVWYWETGKRSPSEESLSKLTRLAGENVNLSVNNSEQNVTSEKVNSEIIT